MKSKLTALAFAVIVSLPGLASASTAAQQGDWASYGQASPAAPASIGAPLASAPVRQGEWADYGQARPAAPTTVASPSLSAPVATGDAANYPSNVRTGPLQRADRADPAV